MRVTFPRPTLGISSVGDVIFIQGKGGASPFLISINPPKLVLRQPCPFPLPGDPMDRSGIKKSFG